MDVASLLQIELQQILVYCDPRIAEKETCCEMPGSTVRRPLLLAGSNAIPWAVEPGHVRAWLRKRPTLVRSQGEPVQGVHLSLTLSHFSAVRSGGGFRSHSPPAGDQPPPQDAVPADRSPRRCLLLPGREGRPTPGGHFRAGRGGTECS